MDIGIVSLIALFLAIAVGFKLNINTGIVGIIFAFILGFFIPDPNGTGTYMLSDPAAGAATLIGGWSTSLFFMVMGMTLLFAIAKLNKTLEVVSQRLIALAAGKTKLLPFIFFVLSLILAGIGPGNIAVCALILPIGLEVARKEKINPLLMATMIISGSNAGGLSPIAPTGLIGINLAEQVGVANSGMHTFIEMIKAQFIFAVFMYIILGGWKLPNRPSTKKKEGHKLNLAQIETLIVIFLVVFSLIAFSTDVGFTGFLGAVVLLLLGAADEKKALEGVPWSTLIMICGVGVLVNVVSISGGITTLSDALASIMTGSTAGALMTVMGGLLSLVSSASGVAMPTLIATIPGMVEQLPVDPSVLITGVILGAHVVTTSPMSTLGGLAIASSNEAINRNKFFIQLLCVGIGGLVFGALLVFIGIVG